MDRKYNIQLNLSPYANVYEDGGLVGRPNGVQLIPIETKGISPSDAVNPNNGNAEGGNKFLNFMNSSGGGGWAAAIGPAATNIANAFLDTEASTADRVAGALGIPALANQWRADTSKGDSYLKGMTSTLDSMSRKNYIQDASSTFGANNAVKLNNKQIISPISPASALPSLKDFKGNWWRNMGASVVQGAAAGSVGGPWGAAGGALTGLLGSLGGLFGRKKQTEKAYEDFLHKRDTLMSAQQNAFNTAVKNQTLSNMQALANGNMSQRINDMANIRAYGGNLFDGGGDLTEEQQMVLADIQADPRILFTPKYSQWRDYIRRTSPDYLDRLYTSLPYEQQQDIYQNDREAWGALSNKAKGDFGGTQVRKKTDEVSPYVAGALGLVGAAPAMEAVAMFPMLENGLNAYFGYEGAKNLPTAVTDAYDYAKKGDWSRAGLSAGEAVLDGMFIGNGIKGIKGISNTVRFKPTSETMEFYHGGLDSDFDFNNLDVFKLAEKQAKKGRDYAGFYMYDPTLKTGAFKYGEGIGAHKINIDRNAKVLDLGNVERVSRAEIQKYKDLGYDMLTGKDVRGKREYVLLNKNAIKSSEFISPETIDSELSVIENQPRVRFKDRYKEDGTYYMPNTEVQNNNTEYAMGGNLYPIGGTIKEGDEEVAQEPVYEGGELPEITVSAESMPWYEKAWRKFDRNVLKYPKYAYNYFFPDKNKFIVLDDDTEINRITDESSAFGNDYILSNEFVEKKNPNTIRTARDFQYPNQDTLLGDKNIPLGNISTYYGIENGKLKAGKASDFEDDTFIVPNRTKNVGKIKEIQLPEAGEYDWGMPWSDQRAKYKELRQEYDDLRKKFISQKKYETELRRAFDKIYGQNNTTVAMASRLAAKDLVQNHQKEFDDYMTDWYNRKKEFMKTITIKEPRQGYVITENNDTLPVPNFNATPKMYFADENGNAAFVAGLKPNIEKVNDYLSEHPSYPIMIDNGRFKHITEGDDINAYTGGFMNPEDNYIIGIKQKAMGGNLYTDLSPNMMSLWNNKQQIDQQKTMNQQFSLGLGNTAFANQFAGGGQMTSADVPENMQYYANGGTHEENPYGGIQVGVDQQGNANLVEKGEFRWHDFVFSDRINVDANLLSSFNLMPTTKHQNKKAAKGKLSYADMAKKYAKRNKELENDPITKNSMEAFMQRLANAQEYQKKAEQLEAQKQNELQDYKTALNKQNNNPMYGTMKYNGMGNAATQQGVNSGVDAGMGNPMSNADLSNVNRSGNEMMAAYGGNLFWRGGKTLNLPPYGDPESRIDYAMSYIGNPIIPNGNSRIDYANQFLQGNPPVNDYGVSDFMNRIYSGNVGSGSPKTFTSPAAQNPVTFDNWYMMQHENGKNPYVGSISSLGERVGGATTDAANNGDGQSSVGYNTASNTGRQDLTGNLGISNKVIGKTTPNTNPDAAVPSDSKEAHLYSTAGKYAQFGKGIMPMIWDWANKTNVKYDPNYRDADRLEALANEGPSLRTADTIGGYRAPNLMDVERLNNSARAEGLAQMQAILDAANGNRGFVGAQSAQNNYNTQMGIGNNYVKTQEANNAERLQTDQFNHGINVANQNAINAMYQDNQRAEQTQHQAALSGTAQAAALRQRENLHADEVNTERMKNRAANQAAYVDNALNYFTTQAMENQELNTRNNDPTNPYWIDKDGRTHYVGDSGLTKAIRDAFGNDEYGRNGTFTGKRLEEWNDLTKNKKYSAKYLKEHPELWQHLVAQQREANKIDADKAKQARMEELKALRGTYQSNLARLNALKDSGAIISDPSYNLYTGWADEDYSGNQGLLRTRNQALDQYITQIGNNYDRYLYEKQLAQNQAKALGGYLNAGQNNNNNYYSYTRI